MLQDFNLFHSLMVMFFPGKVSAFVRISHASMKNLVLLLFGEMFCVCLVGPLVYGTAQIPYVYPSVKLSSSLLKGYIKIPLLLLYCDFFPHPEHMVYSLFVSNENLWIEVVSLGPKYTHPKYVCGGVMEIILPVYFRTGVLHLNSAEHQNIIVRIYGIYSI